MGVDVGVFFSKVWLYLVCNVTPLSRETNCKRYSSGISPSWEVKRSFCTDRLVTCIEFVFRNRDWYELVKRVGHKFFFPLRLPAVFVAPPS